MPPFERHRQEYLDDLSFRGLQNALMKNPAAGDIIVGTGGLRKLRYADGRRGKGKRGGLRVIYYWWVSGDQFWLFTVYDKNEAIDLTADQCSLLANMLRSELAARSSK